MKHTVAIFIVFFAALITGAHAAATVSQGIPTTAPVIALDAPCEVTIYHPPRTKFVHPAWVLQHSGPTHRVAVRVRT